MGVRATQLDVIDRTPRIGSEIRTDLDSLLSGGDAVDSGRLMHRTILAGEGPLN